MNSVTSTERSTLCLNKVVLYQVIDRKTGAVCGQYSTRVAASRRVDKLDNAYGGYRYCVRVIASS